MTFVGLDPIRRSAQGGPARSARPVASSIPRAAPRDDRRFVSRARSILWPGRQLELAPGAVLGQLVAERADADAEFARRVRAITAAFFKRVQDVPFFQIPEGNDFFGRTSCRNGRRRHCDGSGGSPDHGAYVCCAIETKMRGLKLLAVGAKDHGAFDDVL